MGNVTSLSVSHTTSALSSHIVLPHKPTVISRSIYSFRRIFRCMVNSCRVADLQGNIELSFVLSSNTIRKLPKFVGLLAVAVNAHRSVLRLLVVRFDTTYPTLAVTSRLLYPRLSCFFYLLAPFDGCIYSSAEGKRNKNARHGNAVNLHNN